jgi:hypothetical protein
VNVGQPHVAAVEPVCQRFVIQSEQAEDRGVELVDSFWLLDGLVAVLIRRAYDRSSF